MISSKGCLSAAGSSYDNYLKYIHILNQLRAEMVGEDQWPHDKIKKAYHALTKPVIRDVQKGIETGIYRNVDPDLTAYTLTGIIKIMCLRTMISNEYSFEKIEQFISDFVGNGLGVEVEVSATCNNH